MAQIKITPKDVNIELRAGKRIRQLGAARISAAEKLEKRRKELDRLQEEIGRCLLGESRFSEDVLSNQIDRIVSEVRGMQKELDGIESELQNQNAVRDNLGGLYTQFVCWADEFEKADIPRKRMILCELFSHVELRKGYDVSIYINPAYGQFLDGAGENMKTFGEM